MIIGNIEFLDLVPYLPTKIKQAIEYVRDNVNVNTPLGRHDIDGDAVFIVISDNLTRTIKECDPEYHHKYIDIQIPLAGEEVIAISTKPPYTEITDDRLESDDIAFIKTPKEEKQILLQENEFMILYPNEVHKPLCSVEDTVSNIRKVVIKIDIHCL